MQAVSEDSPEEIQIDGEGLRVAIVAARYNQRYVDALLENVLRVLDEAGVAAEDIETIRVPGSNEVAYVIGMLAAGGEFDALVALGVVIQGETPHAEVIVHGTAEALHQITRETETPVINGILAVETEAQAALRSTGKLNRGREFGLAALEMADLKLRLTRRLDEIFAEQEKADRRHPDEPSPQWDELLDEDDNDDTWKS